MDNENTLKRNLLDKERDDKFVERYLNKSRKITSKYLQDLLSLPGRPKELDYFIEILRKVFIENEVVKYKENEKFIGCFCTMFPQEIIRAACARPLLICSTSYAGSSFTNNSLPVVMCPLVRSISENLHKGLNGAIDACDMFLMPFSCDCKKHLVNNLKEYKPTIGLQIPFNKFDDDGVNLFTKQIKEVGEEISKITGVEITRESLAREIRLYGDVQKEIMLFNDLKSNSDILIRGTHALVVMNSFAYDDISNWSKHLQKLNEELLNKKNSSEFLTKKKMPRILLVGSSITFPNIKVPLLIEEQGGIIVSNYSCLGDKPYDDLISVSHDNLHDYYRALANRTIKPCSCHVFPNNETTFNEINEIIKERDIDGIICVSFQGCLTNDIQYQLLTEKLENKNIPMLRLETDLFTEDIEILRVRISAFIEMLNYRK